MVYEKTIYFFIQFYNPLFIKDKFFIDDQVPIADSDEED